MRAQGSRLSIESNMNKRNAITATVDFNLSIAILKRKYCYFSCKVLILFLTGNDIIVAKLSFVGGFINMGLICPG